MNESVQLILSLISFQKILLLPWYIGLPSLALTALLLWSGIWSLFTLRVIRAFSRFMIALVILVILSQAGDAIVALLGGPQPAQVQQ
ncbi:MAG: hypothetical protein WBO55_19640 [Rhizobiaceae bacterium]